MSQSAAALTRPVQPPTSWAQFRQSDDDRAAAERRRRAERWGGCRLEELPERCSATVCGTIKAVLLRPLPYSAVLEAEVCDGTDVVILSWLGRRALAGIHPGRPVRATGSVTCRDGRRIMYNPRYELLPADG